MRTLGLAILQGHGVLAACLGVFLHGRADLSHEAARALTFATLAEAFVAIILVNRSWSRSVVRVLGVPNSALRWVVIGAIAFLVPVLSVPFAQRLFHFAPLDASDAALAVGAGLVCVLWFEVREVVLRQRQ